MVNRCEWCGEDKIYQDYHDNEWGVESHEDRYLFEMLILEGAQAGLSWITILKKRNAYREAFDNFDFKKVANYNEKKVLELLENKGIVRNKLKINSAIKNANVFIEIQEEFGSFDKYIWSFVDNKQIVNVYDDLKSAPTTNELSNNVSKDLKKRGMSFVGSTIIYSYLEAIGIMCNHTKKCYLARK